MLPILSLFLIIKAWPWVTSPKCLKKYFKHDMNQIEVLSKPVYHSFVSSSGKSSHLPKLLPLTRTLPLTFILSLPCFSSSAVSYELCWFCPADTAHIGPAYCAAPVQGASIPPWDRCSSLSTHFPSGDLVGLWYKLCITDLAHREIWIYNVFA